jgi:hypothetical protein
VIIVRSTRSSGSPPDGQQAWRTSQPLLVVINPLASIGLSIWLFDERFTRSPARITIAILAFAVMAVGIVVLYRAAPQDLTPSRRGR